MSKESYTATLLGCGKIGSAMLRSWLDKNLITTVTIIEPSDLQNEFSNDHRIKHIKNAKDHLVNTDLLILAVKPQALEESTLNLKGSVSENTVILSIIAGKNIESLERIFGSDAAIIRSMPNTPASIGKGANVAIANKNISENQRNCVSEVLGALGLVQWIEDETLMNAVTALSGSGPAYIFYLIEILAKSGENLGLTPELAMSLARQTVIGSAALAEFEQNTEASQLRKNVTSPRGTTEAALSILMDGRIEEIFNEALLAAKKRGEELNS